MSPKLVRSNRENPFESQHTQSTLESGNIIRERPAGEHEKLVKAHIGRMAGFDHAPQTVAQPNTMGVSTTTNAGFTIKNLGGRRTLARTLQAGGPKPGVHGRRQSRRR